MSRLLSVILSASIIGSPTLATQTTSSQTPTAAVDPNTLLQQSLVALGNKSVTDITLTASVRRTVGSDEETGTATLKAVTNGSASLDFTFPSGNRSETANLFSTPVGSWSGPDGLYHASAFHNLLAESAWFCPTLVIARRVSSLGLAASGSFKATYVGHELLNGQSVEHISVSQLAGYDDPPAGPTFAHLTQVDFYLDSTTLLPTAMSFNTHPDTNGQLDIPVQIFFSDYKDFLGVSVPTHVQRFFNGTLQLDLQFNSVSVNSGLSASEFSVQ